MGHLDRLTEKVSELEDRVAELEGDDPEPETEPEPETDPESGDEDESEDGDDS